MRQQRPREREQIYHLPFDRANDATVIEPDREEFYAATVAEATGSGVPSVGAKPRCPQPVPMPHMPVTSLFHCAQVIWSV